MAESEGPYKIGANVKTSAPPLYNIVGPRGFYTRHMPLTEARIMLIQLNAPHIALSTARAEAEGLRAALRDIQDHANDTDNSKWSRQLALGAILGLCEDALKPKEPRDGN